MSAGQLPVYALTDEAGAGTALVLSLGTFLAHHTEHVERITPAVQDALDRAQTMQDEECLYAFYLRDGSPEDTVRRVRHALRRTFEAKRRVLWLRADTEEQLKAALAIARSDYTTRAIAPGRSPMPATP
jgi:hypothetical protein